MKIDFSEVIYLNSLKKLFTGIRNIHWDLKSMSLGFLFLLISIKARGRMTKAL